MLSVPAMAQASRRFLEGPLAACLSSVCLAALVNCADSDEPAEPRESTAAGTGGSGSAGGASGSGGTGEAACESLVGKLTDCGVLSGTRLAGCTNDQPVLPCAMACVANAECSEIEAMYCHASYNDYALCLEACHEGLPLPEFVCSDGSRIPASYTCDLVEDCPEGEDEDCPEGMFLCESGLSIEAGWECDGVEDCPDGDDERDCRDSPMVSCGDGSTIVASRECDGSVDCATGVDEQDCAKLECE
jgi:hypothetical protein